MNRLSLRLMVIGLLFCSSSMLLASDWEIVYRPQSQLDWLAEALYFVDADHGWMTGVYNGISHTEDGGLSWREQDSGIRQVSKWRDVVFVNPSQGWIGGHYYEDNPDGTTTWWATILHTTDGGATWEVQKQWKDTYIVLVQFFTSKQGIAWGGTGRLFRTFDGGQSWEERFHAPNFWFWGGVLGAHFLNMDKGWVVSGPKAYHTIDGGQTWSPTSAGGCSWLSNAYFLSSQEGWVAAVVCDEVDVEILHTRDGGQSWQRGRLVGCHWLGGMYFADNVEGWAVGGVSLHPWDTGLVFHTLDSGATWTVQTRLNDEFMSDICPDGDGHLWAVGARGTVLRYTESASSVLPVGKKAIRWGDLKQEAH